MKGFYIDLNNYYPGVNALTLSTLAVHLADKFDDKKDPDPDIARIRRDLPELRGALIFALEAKAEDDYGRLLDIDLTCRIEGAYSGIHLQCGSCLSQSTHCLAPQHVLPELVPGAIGNSQGDWTAG